MLDDPEGQLVESGLARLTVYEDGRPDVFKGGVLKVTYGSSRIILVR